MRPILPAPKSKKEEEPQLTSVCNQGEFFVEPKEVKQDIILKEISPNAEVLKEVDKLLEEFKEIVHDKFANILPTSWHIYSL